MRPLRCSVAEAGSVKGLWWLFRNRFPTKDNLIRRRALHHEDIYCIGGCGCPETTNHLFFSCDIFGSVWHEVYQWLGVSFISPTASCDHFHQFGHMAGLSRVTHSFLKVIWHACVWTLWNERNNTIFKNKAWDLSQLLDNVKFVSFSWLKAHKLTSAFSYNDWWRHPLTCNRFF